MNIQTQKFVTKSDLFSGLDGLENLFNEADHNNITWGDASRTMTTPEYFLSWLDDAETTEEIGEEGVQSQVETLRSRLWALQPDNVMVDLEN